MLASASPLISYFHHNARSSVHKSVQEGGCSIHDLFQGIRLHSEETRVSISMVYTVTQSLLSKDRKETRGELANVWHFTHNASASPEQRVTPPGVSGAGVQRFFFGSEPQITGEVKLAGQAEVCDLLSSSCTEREEKVAGHHPQSTHDVHLYMVNDSNAPCSPYVLGSCY